MTVNIMVDIETLALDPQAVILSIGACVVGAPDEAKFYIELDGVQPHRTVDVNTVHWWKDQLIRMPHGNTSLAQGLVWFAEYITDFGKDVIVWANGSNFDFPVLVEAMNQHKIMVPWKYNAVRDYRTLAKLFPQIPRADKPVAHHALQDAQDQAEHLQAIFNYISRIVQVDKDA